MGKKQELIWTLDQNEVVVVLVQTTYTEDGKYLDGERFEAEKLPELQTMDGKRVLRIDGTRFLVPETGQRLRSS
jgi:DNA integrity scanning protein DisA with diadenylate cyclase activity